MKNNLTRILAVVLTVITLCSLALPSFAAYPKADGYVADEAGVLSESTIRQIKKTNDTLKKEAGITIAVCTVKTTDGVAIAEYARGLYTEWKMGEGVLLLIASEDKNYYLVQSTGVEAHLTSADLEVIRDGYLEEDFAAGNIDSGVLKAFSKLTSELEDGVNFPAVDDVTPDSETEREENKGTGIGSAIVTILKIILYISLFALAAFVILFVVAMFNDDVAALLQRYVFRKGKTNPVRDTYYDERLYGNNGRRPQQNQRPQGQRPQGQYRENPQARRNPNQMYNADGSVRRPQNNGNQNNRGGYGY